MYLEDFSHNFDTLLNSYAVAAGFDRANSPATIVLDEYEKSVFLTKAQEEVVLSLYNGRNSSLQGFEETEELRRYLSDLVKEAELSPLSSASGKPVGVDKGSIFFQLPSDLWFITYESVLLSDGKCASQTTMDVYPVTQDEYHKIKNNPFRGANDRRALRLDLSGNVVEIISKHTATAYYVRYLRKLNPIILVDLGNENLIAGISEATPCELHESLHQRILDRAVEIAIGSRGQTRMNNNRE